MFKPVPSIGVSLLLSGGKEGRRQNEIRNLPTQKRKRGTKSSNGSPIRPFNLTGHFTRSDLSVLLNCRWFREEIIVP